MGWLLGFSLLSVVCGAAEREIVRTFPLAPGGQVSIDTYRGSVTVNEADANDVRISVRLEIGADEAREVERMLRTLQLDFDASERNIAVVARRPEQTRLLWVWEENRLIEPTFRVTVPRRCNLRLSTRAGRIIVGAIEGSVDARVETGDVFIRHVSGSATAIAEMGDVVVSHCDGEVFARVTRGTLRVGTVTGRCDVKNASGDVEVMAAKSDLVVHAEAGAAVVGFPKDFSGRANVRASIGGVVARLDPSANAVVHASASVLARVDSKLASTVLAGRSGSRRLSLRLNGGGSDIVLRGSGGNVLIEEGHSWIE